MDFSFRSLALYGRQDGSKSLVPIQESGRTHGAGP